MGYVPAGPTTVAPPLADAIRLLRSARIRVKVAIIFDHFGPYHLARLRAASKVCTVLGVEMNERSAEYPWVGGSTPYGLTSLTVDDSSPYSGFKRFGGRSRLRQALAEFGPDCVFVPGWSRGYVLAAVEW